MSEDDRPLADRITTVIEGWNIYDLVEAVKPDGTVQYWFCDPTIPPSKDGILMPNHERLGKLPTKVRDRCGLLCGAPTHQNGSPCRTRVRKPGERCSWHRDSRQDALPLESCA